ncbi:hypothetical protein [Halarcobacter sp.]|uniref:hypothetical protein n=1 Tax=Halarcobacter sp. TaxID=2321133 RepID=UPI002AAAE893|nr:hypothetical protein [Halarcobacter sp.]|eukprot:Anaeramoba_ignava/a356347_11.p1 GENE.a356347_11~~a356347_11.p1  ORF type:complete len:107 (-),score=15.24 a356347_11:221-541(-)
MKEQIDVLVLLEIEGLEEKQRFEKHVKREGFVVVEDEEFVYTAKSTTSLFSTKAYILEVFKVALQKQDFKGNANLVFLLNEIPYNPYYYDLDTKEFEEAKVKEETK